VADAQRSPSPAVHAPALGRHRLLGAAGVAALVDDHAVIDWWCPARLDAEPQLWSLLDAAGGCARWWNSVGLRTLGGPVGVCARTTLNIDGEVVSAWDAVAHLDRHPVIVRFVRPTTRQLGVTHELRAGGFLTPAARLAVRASAGDPPHHVDGSTFVSLETRPYRWEAVVLGPPGALLRPIDVDELRAAVDEGERRADALTRVSSVVTAHRDRVSQSLLVLDACTQPETGAVVAAPTTSLPEARGGDRQFDYRFAWLRDASLAASVAALVGHPRSTARHVDWLVDHCVACEGLPSPVTDLAGGEVPEEQVVDHVAGWGGARPVRVGNAAKDQVQLDALGLVAEAVWILFSATGRLRPAGCRVVADLADLVVEQPAGPTHGIWEHRVARDFASADIGRWLLLDRAVRLGRVHRPWAWRRRRRWKRGASAARDRVLGGLLPSGALPLVHGEPDADATGLLAVVLGLVGRDDPVAHRIVDGTLAELGIGDPVTGVRRYPTESDDGFRGVVGAFVPVSWWAVGALAQLGRREEATELADHLCRSLPGLQPEVLDDGEALGNLPMVWSHAEAARALYLLRVADVRARVGRAGLVVWRAWRLVSAQRSGRTERSHQSRKPA
jgi:hypothetical protein